MFSWVFWNVTPAALRQKKSFCKTETSFYIRKHWSFFFFFHPQGDIFNSAGNRHHSIRKLREGAGKSSVEGLPSNPTFKKKKKSVSSSYLFIYLLLAMLGLRCCTRRFFSCSEQGLLFSFSPRASHCGGFSCCEAQGERRLQSFSTRPQQSWCPGLAAPQHVGSCQTGDQIPCPLDWQADSSPLDQREVPSVQLLTLLGGKALSSTHLGLSGPVTMDLWSGSLENDWGAQGQHVYSTCFRDRKSHWVRTISRFYGGWRLKTRVRIQVLLLSSWGGSKRVLGINA